MARRRRRKSSRRWLVVAAAAAAAAAAGFWLTRAPAPPPLAGRAPAVRERPAEPRPAPPRSEPTELVRLSQPVTVARVALVVDDLGRSLREADRLLALGVPVSAAVLPFEPRTGEVAERLRAGGAELLVHLPMEPEGGENPGPGAVLEGERPGRIELQTERAIEAVPGAVGLSNHMGSLVSVDAPALGAILEVVRARGLYFLDSRTTAESLAFGIARGLGVPAARRDVFLDDDPAPEAVRGELDRLFALARERGAAVGIGHPREATFAALEAAVPAARAEGIEFVPVSYLLERSESLPE